jgi:hypothetical protein
MAFPFDLATQITDEPDAKIGHLLEISRRQSGQHVGAK